MSAIFGILRFGGGAVFARDLERMGNVLAHRGPDGRKFIVSGAVGLGHCLMRVNQEDLLERQPLRDRKADLTLVADCRIDNREELAGIFGIGATELRDMPDSALVLRAYKKWGEECAEHLLGDFAFAIWDGRTRKLVLGRDHMGQRCAHYHRGKDFFAFATEIKALWALPDVPRELDESQFGKFVLLDRRPQPGLTLFKNVFGIPGGSTLALRADGDLSMRRYWEPRGDPAHGHRDETYYIETYRRIFAEAVECRVRRLIGPPALCLSAGYDSAAIAGLCGPVLQANGRKLIAVSSVMPDDYRGPLPSARRWVELCRRDMPHLDVRYFVRRDETVLTDFEKTCMAADGIPLLTHYVSHALFREASGAGARLIMDGLLGDSTLNPRGGGAPAYFLRNGQFRRFIAELGPRRRATGRTFWQTLRHDIVWPLTPFWARRAWQTARRGFASAPAWAGRAVAPEFAKARIRAGSSQLSDLIGLTRKDLGMRAQMQQSLQYWAVRHRRNEANEAAAYGLELSRPLADKRVVEFGLSVPEDLYVKNGRNRYLACRALADIYPAEFQVREHSRDMPAPDDVGALKASQPMLEAEIARMADKPSLRKYFDFREMAWALRGPHAETRLEAAPTLALRAFCAARYAAWFEQSNAGAGDPNSQSRKEDQAKDESLRQ
jgi:asparagine synthase (glutamine-hydrolysing)